MSVTLSAGSVVTLPGEQINIASLLNVTAGNDPTYLVVSLLDRNEYTARSNGDTGTLSGNEQTVGFDYLWGDNETTGIVFTYDASTGQYTNATYGDLSNLVYSASTNPGDNTSVSIFTTEDSDIANQYANDPLTLASCAPTSTNYVGSVTVTTQPHFEGPTPEQATPHSIVATAQYCPVNLRGLGQKANNGGAFRVTWGVSDLNRKWSFALASRVFATPESPCISARPCSRRPWTFCRGRPSTASSIDTAATTGRVASVAPSSFASWPSRS
jgi:hypothetical protein